MISIIDKLNFLDFLLIVITLVSMLYGYNRGLVKEVLSIMAMIISTLMSLYFFSNISIFIREYISLYILADAISFGITFILIFSISTIIFNLLSNQIENSSLKTLDRNLGIIFGAARSLVLASIIFIFTSWTFWLNSKPNWLLESRSLPIITYAANIILDITPNKVLDTIKETINISKDKSLIINDKVEIISEPKLKIDSLKNSEGYKKSDNEALDKLINIENNK